MIIIFAFSVIVKIDCETDGSFYSTTLRRYSTLLPLSAAVKRNKTENKSLPGMIVWSQWMVLVSKWQWLKPVSLVSSLSCILSSDNSDFRGEGKYCQLYITVKSCHNLIETVSNLRVMMHDAGWKLTHCLMQHHDFQKMTPKIQTSIKAEQKFNTIFDTQKIKTVDSKHIALCNNMICRKYHL